MIHETIRLSEDEHVTLTAYIHDDIHAYGTEQGRPAIIVLPGGAFAFLSPFEAEPVALTFLQKGFNTFVLRYTVGDDCHYPDVLIEVSSAIKLVRDKAKEWHTDPRQVSLMGFSAGHVWWACLPRNGMRRKSPVRWRLRLPIYARMRQ